jgi:hypothetical protein
MTTSEEIMQIQGLVAIGDDLRQSTAIKRNNSVTKTRESGQ